MDRWTPMGLVIMLAGFLVLLSFFIGVTRTEYIPVPVMPVMGTETYGPISLPSGPYEFWLDDEMNWLQDPSDVSVTLISGEKRLEADVPDERIRMNWIDFDYLLVGPFSYISAGEWEIVLKIRTQPVSEFENLTLVMISWDTFARDGMVAGTVVMSAGIVLTSVAQWYGVKGGGKDPQ